MSSQTIDALTFGRRLRYYRRQAGLTLQSLGEMVGRPAPYLSMLENGRREPKLSHIADLAEALDVEISTLLDPAPPTRRAEMEIELERMQSDPRFASLDLPYVRPSPTLSDELLTHLVGLYRALAGGTMLEDTGRSRLRAANANLRRWLTEQNGYLSDIEAVAAGVLEKVGYSGEGPLSSRSLLDIAEHLGFRIEAVEDMVPGARSVIDHRNGRIYIAQRNELRTRQARKAILQTLGGRFLGHTDAADSDQFLRQRMESAYLAAAILVPEASVVRRLRADKAQRDISIEDIKELYYVSYEMAAWRFVNLATERLGIDTHLVVSEESGLVLKGYSNDEVPFVTDPEGGIEAQPVCRHWGAAAVFNSEDKFDVHAQYTDTSAGTYFCLTHMEPDRPFAVTIGVPFEAAQWLRHRDTDRRATSRCPEPDCCRQPTPEQSAKWDGKIEVSARSQDRLLGLLASDPYPNLRDRMIYDLVERYE